jgi:TatD DNase family protein
MADKRALASEMAAHSRLTLIDSHCHIDMPQFDADRDQAVARARTAGVETMLIVGGVDAEAGHRRAIAVAEKLGLPASAGVHPHEARLAAPATYDELRALAHAKRIVAIGEIGLDFYYDHSPRDVQREVFRAAGPPGAATSACPSSSTRARPTTSPRPSRRREGREGRDPLLHGRPRPRAPRPALGFYISFSGILAFPKSDVIQEVARDDAAGPPARGNGLAVPGPAAHRGKRNEPAFVVEVAKKVAACAGYGRGSRPASAANFRRLFGRATP